MNKANYTKSKQGIIFFFAFQALLLVVANHLVGMERVQRVRTPLDIVLLMVLWVLANPDTFRSVALRFGCQPGTVYFHYSYIIECLREMAPTYIRWPNANERAEIKEAFQAYSGFPGIIGVIDGTHNVITAPVRQKRRYRNRFQSYSLNTQVVCDHTLLIREIHIGEVGSVFDQRALSRSPLYRKLLEALQEFLGFDEHLIGDGAYTLIRSLLVPFRNIGNLTPQQRLYNQLLSRCRARIEHAFGKAFGQWRRMKFLHCVNLDIAVDHIMACFVLHNFMILHGEVMLVSIIFRILFLEEKIETRGAHHSRNPVYNILKSGLKSDLKSLKSGMTFLKFDIKSLES